MIESSSYGTHIGGGRSAFLHNTGMDAIVICGQSNVGWGDDYGFNPTPTGGLDLGIKQLGRSPDNNFVVSQSGLTNIETQMANGAKVSFGYPLAKSVREFIGSKELLVIAVAQSATGFNQGDWAAGGVLFEDLIDRIRFAVGTMRCNIKGIFWAGGESDAESLLSSPVYKHILPSFASHLRSTALNSGQFDAMSIPFVTFDMVSEWVGVVPNRVAVQNALTNIGAVLPFSANADTTNMPLPTEADIIHYDSAQTINLASRMFDAWVVAKINSFSTTKPVGEYVIYNMLQSNTSSNIWQALDEGLVATDPLYSILGELWKYQNTGKYKFRVEWQDATTLTEHNIVFEQAEIPLFTTTKTSAASLISATVGAKWGHDAASGFGGITFAQNADTLLKLGSISGAWSPIGSVTQTWIPWVSEGGVTTNAKYVRVIVIVE